MVDSGPHCCGLSTVTRGTQWWLPPSRGAVSRLWWHKVRPLGLELLEDLTVSASPGEESWRVRTPASLADPLNK